MLLLDSGVMPPWKPWLKAARAGSSHFDSDHSRIRGGPLVREIGRRLGRCFDCPDQNFSAKLVAQVARFLAADQQNKRNTKQKKVEPSRARSNDGSCAIAR